MTEKEKIRQWVEDQPDDASGDEIRRALSFQLMLDRGLKDSRAGNNEDMGKRIRQWQD